MQSLAKIYSDLGTKNIAVLSRDWWDQLIPR